MARRCVDALTPLWHQRRCQHGPECDCLVFPSRAGTPLDRHSVLRRMPGKSHPATKLQAETPLDASPLLRDEDLTVLIEAGSSNLGARVRTITITRVNIGQ